jgi:proteasome lid subunit RPN8/RPN11
LNQLSFYGYGIMTGELKPQLILAASHLASIRRAAADAYPGECCGLLVGEGDRQITVTEVVPMRNMATDPRKAFAIDPQAQFDLLRATRRGSTRIIGHYHSHPDGQARPSVQDLAMAHDPEAIWIIVAVSPHIVSMPRAFQRPLHADSFQEITLKETP